MNNSIVFDLTFSDMLGEKLNLRTLDTISLMWYYRYEFDYFTIEQ